jgi:hypothetical protein
LIFTAAGEALIYLSDIDNATFINTIGGTGNTHLSSQNSPCLSLLDEKQFNHDLVVLSRA